MERINDSRRADDPELIIIARANREGIPYIYEGARYSLADWNQMGDRVDITLIPYSPSHRPVKHRSQHSEQP